MRRFAGLERVHEYQRYDGWYNNLANPQWGSVGSRLHRDAPSNYEDGVYRMQDQLPSARALSGLSPLLTKIGERRYSLVPLVDLVFKGPSGLRNQRNLTAVTVWFR